jgi:MFS family permease
VSSSNQPSLAPYANLLKFGFFNATTWMIGLGTPLVLLAGELGASSFQVGIAYAFVLLLLPVQILATYTLPRFGYKRQVIFGWAARGVFLLIPLGLASIGPSQPAPWMVYSLIASSFFFSFFRAIGGCAVMPMIYATLPDAVRGRYFATDQAVTGLSGIMTLLLCAALFRLLPTYDAFFWQYAYAIIGTFFTIYYLSQVEDPPKPTSTSLKQIATETPRICLSKSPFRQFLLMMGTNALTNTAFIPLQAYYLKTEAGLSMDRILSFSALQYLGVIIGTLLTRNHVDRIGAKPVFRLSLLSAMAISLYWIFLIQGHSALFAFLPLAFFSFGCSTSLWVTATLKYLPRVCDERKQALHVSVHSAMVGLVGGIAPILWGYLVKIPGNQPGVRTDTFTLFFVALLVSQIGIFFYIPRLTSEHRERPALLTSAGVLRQTRYLSALINLTGHNGHGPKDQPQEITDPQERPDSQERR